MGVGVDQPWGGQQAVGLDDFARWQQLYWAA